MSSSATCIVATFGDRRAWTALASRAVSSAYKQRLPFEDVIWYHGETLQDARNTAAEAAISEWLVFLDADDELDTLYLQRMLEGEGDIRRPITQGVVDGVEEDPQMIPRTDMRTANCIVIGAMIRREDFLAVGGFADYEVLEDWDLWVRMLLNGAKIGDCPEAIYRIHVRTDSRNMNSNRHTRIYTDIRAKASSLLNCYID